MDEIYTLTDALIKSKQESKTKANAKYWKFVFLINNEEVRMNCFDYDIGKDVGAGERVDVDYLSRGDFKNAKAFRPSSQQSITEERVLDDGTIEKLEETYTEKAGHTDNADFIAEEPVVEEVKYETPKPKTAITSSLMATPTNRNNKKINPDFIVNIQGKDFITANGLLALAEEEGGIEKIEILDTQVDFDRQSAYTKARVTMKDGRTSENCGSATPANLKSTMQKHYVEMSTTRSISRCIRTLLNVDYVAVEELAE